MCEEYVATVTDRSVADDYSRFTLELSGCYPVEWLSSLQRAVTSERETPSRATVEDSVEFSDREDHEAQAVFVSYLPTTRGDGDLLVDGERTTGRLRSDSGTEPMIDSLENAVADRDV